MSQTAPFLRIKICGLGADGQLCIFVGRPAYFGLSLVRHVILGYLNRLLDTASVSDMCYLYQDKKVIWGFGVRHTGSVTSCIQHDTSLGYQGEQILMSGRQNDRRGASGLAVSDKEGGHVVRWRLITFCSQAEAAIHHGAVPEGCRIVI